MIKLIIVFSFLLIKPTYAYVDPAAGNAFFTLAITIVSAVLFAFQYLYDHLFIFKGFLKKNKKTIPLLLYSEGNAYWPWFEPILDELEKQKISTQYYTSAPDDLCFEKKYQYIHPTFIGQGNKAYAKMAFIKADIVLMTTPGLDVYQLRRSKYVKKYIHFYHSCDDGCTYRLFGVDYYDVLLIDSEINGTYIRELEQKRNLPAKELVVVGNILLDELHKKAQKLKVTKNKEKTVLISPSWGRETVLYQCGEQLIDELLKTPYKIIIRPHPQMKIDNPKLLETLQNKYPESQRIHWDFERDNLPSMAKSDIMISDFSSIIFEYAYTFLKPVITFNKTINWEQYDASDLSHPTWKYKVWEELGARITDKDIPQISETINTLLQQKDKSIITKEASKYWKEQGKCIQNIVNYIKNSLNQQ